MEDFGYDAATDLPASMQGTLDGPWDFSAIPDHEPDEPPPDTTNAYQNQEYPGDAGAYGYPGDPGAVDAGDALAQGQAEDAYTMIPREDYGSLNPYPGDLGADRAPGTWGTGNLALPERPMNTWGLQNQLDRMRSAQFESADGDPASVYGSYNRYSGDLGPDEIAGLDSLNTETPTGYNDLYPGREVPANPTYVPGMRPVPATPGQIPVVPLPNAGPSGTRQFRGPTPDVTGPMTPEERYYHQQLVNAIREAMITGGRGF